jgi:uncharacterized repeat protein (TIGR03803 family)
VIIRIRSLFLLPALMTGLGLIPVGSVTAQTFTNLHSFTALSGPFPGTNSDGAYLLAGLILSGNTLYGVAVNGGPSGRGSVFAVNIDGRGFTNLHSFPALDPASSTNSEGSNPQGSLILSGDTLYGTASSGGNSGNGTVFRINTNGRGFTTCTVSMAITTDLFRMLD